MARKYLELIGKEPWKRQKGESQEAFEAFQMYRDSERKIGANKVAAELGKSTTLVERWCTCNRWVERREAFMDYQDDLTLKELEKGIAKMRKSHTAIANQMLVKALKGLEKLPAEELDANDITKLVDVAAKLERLSRGESTERTENKTEVSGEVSMTMADLGRLSTEELERLGEIADKLADQ